MSARTARLYVVTMAVLAAVVAVSLFFIIRHQLGPKDEKIVFSVQIDGLAARRQVVNGYAFDEDGEFTRFSFFAHPGDLTEFVVPIRTNTISVSIFAPVHSMSCGVFWFEGGDVVEEYSQVDIWDDPELPKCDWRRHYSNDGERR